MDLFLSGWTTKLNRNEFYGNAMLNNLPLALRCKSAETSNTKRSLPANCELRPVSLRL